MGYRGKGQRIRRKEARRRRLHALERLEQRYETASPEDAELIAEEADALARKITPYSKCPKSKENA